MILTHPIEIKRRRIATGRMAHLSLAASRLMMGSVYGSDERVNSILRDVNRYCVLLYPGRQSSNLTNMPLEARKAWVPFGKRLTVFVVDGTWNTAKKTVNQSPNLNSLPRICFTPPTPSNFRVRQQPRADCYSTIEAIHHTIELLGPAVGFNLESRSHDHLLLVFGQMVEKQISLANSGKPSRRLSGKTQ
jgi:DTW domain-containing protein YfiP